MNHIVKAFDEDVKRVGERFDLLLQAAADWTSKSCIAVATMDNVPAREVLVDDIYADPLRREIFGASSLLLVKRAPFAIDFRRVITARDMSIDMTEVCGCAKRIAKEVIDLTSNAGALPIQDFGFKPMADTVREQMESIVTAYSTEKVGNVNSAWEALRRVEDLDEQITRRIFSYLDGHNNAAVMGMRLIQCAHQLRRISAHNARATEAVMFLVTGTVLLEQRVLPDEFIGSRFERTLVPKKAG